MSLNPILFANQVNEQFIRYQLTAFPISDPDLSEQAKNMLRDQLDKNSPLFKGPYISLSRQFEVGPSLRELVEEKKLHRGIDKLIPIKKLFQHQAKALEAINENKHCLITTGTGSGKTESFLIPIINHCFKLKDENAEEGIVAILIYPMNALASDQLSRLREILAGTGISFGLYVGSTPPNRDKYPELVQMQQGENWETHKYYLKMFEDRKNITIAPWEERVTREEIVEKPPRILLTNPSQLEFLMTRNKDIPLFIDTPLKFLVLDEAHTYTGAMGAEVAMLVRRLRKFTGKSAEDVVCIGTSATITDPSTELDISKRFMERLFGIDINKIEIIGEEYSDLIWPKSTLLPPIIGVDSQKLFEELLRALEGENLDLILPLISRLTGVELHRENWKKELYLNLKQNTLIKQLYDTILIPQHLYEATKEVFQKLGRTYENIFEAIYEILIFLTLGAAAEDETGPLIRPKLHYFVRGLRNAGVVLHPMKGSRPKAELFFSADMAIEKYANLHPTGIFPLLVCMNCGQHYFEFYLEGVNDDAEVLSGGQMEEQNVYFPRTDEELGSRFIFTNNFISENDEEEEIVDRRQIKLDKKRLGVYLCRFCGTIHKSPDDVCRYPNCSRDEELLSVDLVNEKGKIATCPSCGYRGGGTGDYTREPFRRLRAVGVADIHILAQELINKQRPEQRKLLIFSDNRQDAAFQAAWIAQRARKYRIRHIIYDLIKDQTTPIPISGITDEIYQLFNLDKELAVTLAPEVFTFESDDAYGSKVKDLLKKYIRMIILQEFTQSIRSYAGLESWGLAKVVYHGISEDEFDPELEKIAREAGLTLDETKSLVENLLDVWRRKKILHDHEAPIFGRYWHNANIEIQRGLLPDVFSKYTPNAIKLLRSKGDKAVIVGVASDRGQTTSENFLKKIGISPDKIRFILELIWDLLVKKSKTFIQIDIKSTRNVVFAGGVGGYQIDSSKLGIVPQYEFYRCNICQRIHTRNTPKMKCTAIHCDGTLLEMTPTGENYDINSLMSEFSMIIAKEHTAQVPAKDRQEIENKFKDPTSNVNCIVSSPTMELGVDIGALDVILMRNVPPMPSNYWQRSGRAGRRHRLAVIYTYCRKNIHDDYFFEDPLRMLNEKIGSPKFNLKNPVMIQKHSNAFIMSNLFKLTVENFKELVPEDYTRKLSELFPSFIIDLLFERTDIPKKKRGRKFLQSPMSVDFFRLLYENQTSQMYQDIKEIFQKNWPEEALEEVSDEILLSGVSNFLDELQKHYNHLYRQLRWTIETRNRIMRKKMDLGTLEEFDRRIMKRCDDWISDIQKDDLDNYTLTVLSRLGFLPTYGKDTGNITAFANSAFSLTWNKSTFEIRRSETIAIYEFAPGNLIYANGGKYRNSLFHFTAGAEGGGSSESILEPDEYIVNLDIDKISEKGEKQVGYVDATLHEVKAIPMCDVDIGFLSHVSDDENYRYRMPTTILGYRKKNHRGGQAYNANGLELHHLYGQKLRLVNIGPARNVRKEDFGYPICLVCGGNRSPLSSDAEKENFITHHRDKSCKIEPEQYGISTEITADSIVFKNFKKQSEAINYGEAIRMGSSIVLEMNRTDLELLLVPQTSESFDIVLYDPMPGGSGLLTQIIEQWREIMEITGKTLECSNQCKKSCYRCLRTYRNMMNHEIFDRKLAKELIEKYSSSINFAHGIPEQKAIEGPNKGLELPVNLAEHRLKELFKERGFPEFEAQKEIEINAGNIKRTTPDFYYEDDANNIKLAIYLDGLSNTIHGKIDKQQIDQLIRLTLRKMGIEVIEIASSQLDDLTLINLKLEEINFILKIK